MAWPRGTPPAPVLSVQFLRKCTPEGRPRRRTMAGRGRGGRAVAQRGVGRGGRLHAIAALPEAWAASRGAVGVPRTGTVGVVAVRSARTASGPSTLTPSTRHARRSTAPEWSPTASCRGDGCHGSPTPLASRNFVLRETTTSHDVVGRAVLMWGSSARDKGRKTRTSNSEAAWAKRPR